MTAEQFAQLLAVMTAPKMYTLTGAADWPMLVKSLSLSWGLVVVLGGAMWADLRKAQSISDSRWQKDMADHAKTLDEKAHDNKVSIERVDAKVETRFNAVLETMKDCQAECCPRRKT